MTAKTCGECGASLKEGARFCTSCGTAVEAGPSQAPPPKEQDLQSGPEDKKVRRWLPLALAGAGLIGVVVVVVLAVNPGWYKHAAPKSDRAPSPPGQVEQAPAAGWQPDREGPAGSAPQEAGADTGWQADTPSAARPQGSQAQVKSGEQPGGAEKNSRDIAQQYLAEGLEAAKTGDFQSASRKFRSAIKLLPNDASAWNNLGLALRKLGKLEQAIDAYQKAIKIKPEFALAHKNLGVALEKTGRRQQAARAYLRYTQLHPTAADAAVVKRRAEILLAGTKQKAEQP